MAGGIHPPLEVIQEWAKIGNPLHPTQTRDWGLAVLIIVVFALTMITVCARLWARIIIQRNAGLDDAIIVAAMIPTIGLAVAIALASRLYGFNRHAYDLTPELAVRSRKITMVIEAMYIASTGLTKISILLFYKRMSDGTVSTLFRFAVHVCIAFVVCYIITFEATLFLGCRPIHSYWDQVNIGWALKHVEGVDYHCFNEPANLLAASATSIVQDFIACGMPTLLFWKLQLPRRQKIALGAIFGVGFFLCITGILRIIYISDIYFHTYDVTWAAERAWVWTGVEAHLAIVCASAPALKAFFKQYLNVSSLSNSFGNSWRQRSYQPKGYFFKPGITTLGTSSSVTKTAASSMNSKGAQTDIELGGIAVTRQIDIDSESMRQESDGVFSSTKTSQEQLRGPSRQQLRTKDSVEAPWNNIDPPLSRQPSAGRMPTWRD